MLKKQVKTLEEMLKLNPEKVLAQRNASHNTDKLKIFSHWCLVKKLIAVQLSKVTSTCLHQTFSRSESLSSIHSIKKIYDLTLWAQEGHQASWEGVLFLSPVMPILSTSTQIHNVPACVSSYTSIRDKDPFILKTPWHQMYGFFFPPNNQFPNSPIPTECLTIQF